MTQGVDQSALEQARAVDASGAGGGLRGIPLAIKDVISTEGLTTTCGSKMLEEYTPPYDATVIGRLKDAGAVLIGKTNCDEFAMGSSTERSAYFPTRNPWDLERVPGGSSGGSAAAVAAGEAPGALGTDTGGSIRQPASLCGVTGLKPTYGRVSRFGLVAFASSLDQIGPFAWTARDCATILGAVAGADPRDSTAALQPVPDYTAALTGDVRGLRVGVPQEYFVEGMEPGVERAVRAAIDVLCDRGAEIVEVSLPHTKYALPAYYIIAPAEASSNLARYDGMRYGLRVDGANLTDTYEKTRAEGFGTEVKRRILIGTYVLSAGYYDAYYLKALKVRRRIADDFDQAFQKIDALLTPTAPSAAFALGDKSDDPVAMYLNDIFTVTTNLAGLPGMSLPAGVDASGLPLGLQLIGRPLDEGSLFSLGGAIEKAAEFRGRPQKWW